MVGGRVCLVSRVALGHHSRAPPGGPDPMHDTRGAAHDAEAPSGSGTALSSGGRKSRCWKVF